MGKENEDILSKEIQKKLKENFPELDEKFFEVLKECLEEYDDVLKKLVDK